MNINDNHWIFPALDKLTAETVEYKDDAVIKEYEDKINALMKELEEKDGEIKKLQTSLNEVADSQQNQLNTFNEFTKRIESSLPVIHDNHLSFIVNIIKLISTKIIYKEIDKDNTIIKKVLDNLLEQIDQDGLLTVEVSSKDFEILSQVDIPKSIKLVIRSELTPGDMIVVSKNNVCIRRIGELLDLMLSQYYE